MQIIERILMVDGSTGTWTDAYGKRSVSAPELVIGIKAALRLDLRSNKIDTETGMLLPLPVTGLVSDAYYLALDADYDQTTTPKLLKTSGISVESTDTETVIIAELPNTAVSALVDAVAKNLNVSLNGELGGYSSDGSVAEAMFCVQFPLLIRNRIWLGDTVPDDVASDPEYLTATEVKALIAEATRPPKGDKGDDGDSAYEVAVANGYVGTVAEWIASLKGNTGKSAYELAVDIGYTGTVAEWIASLKGNSGDSAYAIAVANGYTGSVTDWLDDLKGQPGADGHGLEYDASGKLSELSSYADRPAGFVFAASEIDSANKKTTVWYYRKKSSDYGDWYPPLQIVMFESAADVQSLAPLSFNAPSSNAAQYLYFDLSKYPNATVAAVTINTADGELTLPYGVANGVSKIIRTTTGRLLLYLGDAIPTYDNGKIYLSQFLGLSNAIDPDVPVVNESIWYGYINDGATYAVSQITADMLTGDTVTETTPAELGKTAINAPAGAVVFVLIPTAADLTATKDDGLGGKVAFALDNGATGTGSNGATLTIGDVEYSAYGEFALTNATTYIYID